MVKRAIIAILVFLVLLFGYHHFNSNDVDKHPNMNMMITEETSNTLTVSHYNGITTINKNPKRIVVLDYSVLDNINSMGIDIKEIATSSNLIPSYIDTSKFHLTNVGNLKEPDLEAIYNFKPDLIIINGRQMKYYDNLSKIAPTINLSTPKDMDYKDSLYSKINLIGKIFDKENKSLELCMDIDKQINAVQSMNGIHDKGMILFIVGNKMFAVGPNSMMGGLPYDTCNLESVVTERSQKQSKIGPYADEISFEYIRDKNPEYILVVNKDAAVRLGSAKNKSFIMDNPLLKDIPAVKNDRVIFVNSEVWYLAGGGYKSTSIMLDEIKNAISH